MKFLVHGVLHLPNRGERTFKKEVVAKSKEHAIDKVYALFGSNNGLKRTKIEIKSVEEVN
jgi:ribosomal protein L20A (L18A)